MEFMLIMSAVGALVGAIGGAIAEGDFEKARALRQQALDEYGEDILPVLDRVVAQEVGESAFAQLTEDPSIRGAQTDVMDELRNVYESEGMTDADRAALQVAQNEVAQRAASDRASLQQRLARTGQTGNAALEAAAGATISGDAVGATADMTLRAQMAARQRALQALTARGGLAGDVRGADLAFGSARASGQDRINLFNASQRADAANQNNANALSVFNAEIALKNARNTARGQLADEINRKGQRTAQSAAGLGKSFTSAGSAFNQGGK
jgi:hypothetical protein